MVYDGEADHFPKNHAKHCGGSLIFLDIDYRSIMPRVFQRNFNRPWRQTFVALGGHLQQMAGHGAVDRKSPAAPELQRKRH